MKWTLLDTGIQSAKANMQIDQDLLSTLDQHQDPILHFYEWDGPSATYGHLVNPADYLDLKAAKERGLQLAKRPTGGGIVFHIWDLAFSVLVPASHPYFSSNTLENYAFVNEAVLSAITPLVSKLPGLIPEDASSLDASCMRFCMAKPTKYDVVLEGRKIAGAAQRKTKKGFLHQGTIALSMPDEEFLRSVLLPHTKVLEAMRAFTFPLKGNKTDLKREIYAELTRKEAHVQSSH